MRRKKGKRILIRVLVGSLFISVAIVVSVLIWLEPYTELEMDMTLMEIPTVNRPAELYVYEPENRPERSGSLRQIADSAMTQLPARIYTPYADIPTDLIHAFVSIEDKRFWKHEGVDFFRTAQAGFHYLVGNPSFGGSTITQQLIKNLTGRADHSVDRKLTEIFCALDLENQADKEKILETYLNVINLAEGCYGVGAAAERYYSKEVSMLSLSECATIAAITNNPARYDPMTHPEQNIARRNLILREMAKQGYITEAQRDHAIAQALNLNPTPTPSTTSVSSWYVDMVIADVIRDLQERCGYTYTTASLLVYQGGLKIETTMDESLQKAVEAYYADVSHFPMGDHGRPQSSVILLDPYTGDILAVAGAVGQKRAHRLQNYATDTRRPAGSCIKPLTVYAPALEKGLITWASIFEDEPVAQKQGNPWPSNADGMYRGRVTVGQGMAHSLNPVAVRILEQIGIQESFSFARDRLGLRNLVADDGSTFHDQTVSSLALGQQSYGVSVRELTAAYSVFIDGIYCPAISYHRVLDREGNLLLENPPVHEANRVLSVGNAAIMTKLLTKVTEEGTAARYMNNIKALGIEAAGKTGTTQNNCDRWFVGYTPRLLAGVWMGFDYPTELGGIQGNPCVTIWDDLMKVCEPIYNPTFPQNRFSIPDQVIEVEFCPLSGKLRNQNCADPVYGHTPETGWFVRGTEPKDACSLHVEPPIHVVPMDPQDPERIPLLPNDMIPESAPTETETDPEAPWYSRWFSFFSRHEHPKPPHARA